jgi:hypothetical protein
MPPHSRLARSGRGMRDKEPRGGPGIPEIPDWGSLRRGRQINAAHRSAASGAAARLAANSRPGLGLTCEPNPRLADARGGECIIELSIGRAQAAHWPRGIERQGESYEDGDVPPHPPFGLGCHCPTSHSWPRCQTVLRTAEPPIGWRNVGIAWVVLRVSPHATPLTPMPRRRVIAPGWTPREQGER